MIVFAARRTVEDANGSTFVMLDTISTHPVAALDASLAALVADPNAIYESHNTIASIVIEKWDAHTGSVLAEYKPHERAAALDAAAAKDADDAYWRAKDAANATYAPRPTFRILDKTAYWNAMTDARDAYNAAVYAIILADLRLF